MDIKPWQEKLVNDIMQGRELKLMMSGRQTGKSHWTNQAVNRLMKDLMNRPVEELILSEGKVYGDSYYCVEPIGGNWIDIETWCLDTFGNPGCHMWDSGSIDTEQRWYMNDRKFWFRNERDRTMFILRWSTQ
jgi:hypothetical protein